MCSYAGLVANHQELAICSRVERKLTTHHVIAPLAPEPAGSKCAGKRDFTVLWQTLLGVHYQNLYGCATNLDSASFFSLISPQVLPIERHNRCVFPSPLSSSTG